MKKILIIFILIFNLSSCFNIETKKDLDNNTIENSEENIDEQIKKEQEKLQELENISEKEIDELINSIIE